MDNRVKIRVQFKPNEETPMEDTTLTGIGALVITLYSSDDDHVSTQVSLSGLTLDGILLTLHSAVMATLEEEVHDENDRAKMGNRLLELGAFVLSGKTTPEEFMQFQQEMVSHSIAAMGAVLNDQTDN